jgi:hypothetical protein
MALPSEKPRQSALYKGLQEVKNQINGLLQKMKKNPKFSPTRDDLVELSRDVVNLIDNYHPKITSEEKKLLMAIIDLNDAPIMHPSMQRISYEVALRDAGKNLEKYLENHS